MSILDALACKNQNRPPVWLMRQAGRYLPEYQKIREKRSLLEMFHCPETIYQVTKLPLQIFDLDAAIVFSDILIVLDGLGIRWDFEEKVGPVIAPFEGINEMHSDFPYAPLSEAIVALKKELKIPLLGFSGAPFTIASYLIEGKTSKDLQKTKRYLYSDPAHFHILLEKITQAIIHLLKIQIKAGVDAIQIFDSWAGHLSLDAFQNCSISYLKKIVSALAPFNIPIIVFCRGSSLFANELVQTGASCISLDWTLPIHTIRKIVPHAIALQGNLDPSILFAPKQTIKYETKKILNSMRNEPGFIFNLGHGILPYTPVDNVKALLDCLKNQ